MKGLSVSTGKPWRIKFISDLLCLILFLVVVKYHQTFIWHPSVAQDDNAQTWHLTWFCLNQSSVVKLTALHYVGGTAQKRLEKKNTQWQVLGADGATSGPSQSDFQDKSLTK